MLRVGKIEIVSAEMTSEIGFETEDIVRINPETRRENEDILFPEKLEYLRIVADKMRESFDDGYLKK